MSRVVRVVIAVDEHGHMTVDASGPINGKEGLLTVLEEARRLTEQSIQEGTGG